MANLNSGAMDERRKLIVLLDRLDAVQCMADMIVDQWIHGDADARRKIEEAIDRMPKKSH